MPTCYKPIVTITKKMDRNEYEENEKEEEGESLLSDWVAKKKLGTHTHKCNKSQKYASELSATAIRPMRDSHARIKL